MKKTILGTFLFFALTISYSQEWQTNFDKAKEIALNENKKIILVFQGSDWCAPCIKLDKEIRSTKEFTTYAKKHFVMLKADFPRKKKNKLSETVNNNNKKLMELYNKKGFFPFVVVLDKNGNSLGETGYKKISPSEYIKTLSSF